MLHMPVALELAAAADAGVDAAYSLYKVHTSLSLPTPPFFLPPPYTFLFVRADAACLCRPLSWDGARFRCRLLAFDPNRD